MLVYTLYVARTRRRGVPQVRGTVIYVHTLLDEAEGKVCVTVEDMICSRKSVGHSGSSRI